MLTVVIGFATTSINSAPTVVFCGQAGDAMQAAIDAALTAGTHARIYRYNLLDRGIPIKDTRVPPPPPEPPEEPETQPAKAETQSAKGETKASKSETKHPEHETKHPKK